MIKPDGRPMSLYSRRPISDQIQATNPKHEPFTPTTHLRWHPLRGEWVAYATHRQNRTFLPPKEYSPLAVTKSADFPTELPAGDYDVAVFENLFPSLNLVDSTPPELYTASRAGTGLCEVLVFTQDPDTSLGKLSLDEVFLVLKVMGERTKEIGAKPEIKYVLPFENRGVEVGVTLHHPHGQIYCYHNIPPVPARMLEMQKLYLDKNGTPLMSDILKSEEADGRRMLINGEKVKAFVPVCARYPYETWIAPVRPVSFLHELSDDELYEFARVLKTMLMKFDAFWNKPFPYLMAVFQAPTDGALHPESHAHIEFFPALRTQDKLKYLAGTEIAAGMFVNDSSPEEKAAELRDIKIDWHGQAIGAGQER